MSSGVALSLDVEQRRSRVGDCLVCRSDLGCVPVEENGRSEGDSSNSNEPRIELVRIITRTGDFADFSDSRPE